MRKLTINDLGKPITEIWPCSGGKCMYTSLKDKIAGKIPRYCLTHFEMMTREDEE